MECWAWERWRDLAHRAGHFARSLDAARDDVTERRMACGRSGCQWVSHVAEVVGGRRANPPPDDDLSMMGIWESLGVIAALFTCGFAGGLFYGWMRNDPEIGPLLPLALMSGGVFGTVGVVTVVWA